MRKIVITILAMLLLISFVPFTLRAQDPPPVAPVECAEEYQVQVGDTLAAIAEKTLGDPLAFPVLLVLANAGLDDEYTNINDPSVIEADWIICIPSPEEVPELLATADPAILALARQAGFNVPPPLENTLWVLVGYGTPAEPALVEPGTVVTAQFTDDGSLTGSGGCNTYTTSFEFGRNNNITIQPAASTRMFCPTGMEQEQFYLAALEQATAYQITPAGFLEIEYRAGRLSSESLFFVAGQANLKNTQWVLQSFGDPQSPQPVEPATTITAVFTGPAGSTEGALVGFGGCNSYSTSFAVQGDQIAIDPAMSGLMACAVGSAQEATYLALLQEAQTFQLAGKQLQLTGPNGLLTYTSVNLPLEQVLWSLESFGDPAAQQPVSAETEITALFVAAAEAEVAGGTVSGSAGCNRYSAGYKQEGRQLTLGPAMTSLMACETGMEAEQTFLAALGTVERYQTLGDQLRLFYDDGQQVMTFRADRTPLQETYWQLTAYGPLETPQFPAAGAAVTAVFERQPAAPTGMVAGSTGCNSYSATFAASLTQIKVNPPLNTFAFCEGAVGEVERAFLQGLASAESYTIIGSTLQVGYDGGKQALSFVASQPPVEIPAPTAVIGGPTSARVGDTVSFNGSRSQSELTIVQYSWDFGDGVTASGEVVNHIYGRPGTYTLRLTVFDERGVSNSVTMLINISAAPAQGPTAVIEGPTNAVVGQSVTFRGDNSVAGSSPIVTYAWSVKGFQLSSGSNARFTTSADQPGRYEVVLTVTDQNGLSDSASLRVEVAPRQEPQTPPTAVIEGPTSAVVGQDVTFQGGNSIPGSTPIVVYGWSVDGVAPARSADVRFTTRFDRPGRYEVGLTVTDQNGLSHTSRLGVTVQEAPPAAGPTAVIAGPSQAVVGEDVTFQGGNSIPGSSPIVVYAWGVDGVQRTSTPDVRFTTRFDQAGAYNVSLTVTDQNGLSNSSSLQVIVTAPELPPTPTEVPPTPTEVPPTPTDVPPTPTDVPPVSPLEGTSWELQGTLPDARITAEFRGGTISGSGGCNTYSGPYTSTGSNNISVGGLVTSQMACDEAIMEQEQAYLAALGTAQSYSIAGNTLTIAHAGGALTFQQR